MSSRCTSDVFCSNRSNSRRSRSMFDARSSVCSRLRSPATTTAVALVERALARVDGRRHQHRDVLAQLAQLVGEAGADRRERRAGVVVVEEIGRLGELRLRVGALGVEDAVLHVAFGGDDDQQHAPVGQAQELEMAEARLAAPGRRHHAGEVRQLATAGSRPRSPAPAAGRPTARPASRVISIDSSGLTTIRLSTNNR